MKTMQVFAHVLPMICLSIVGITQSATAADFEKGVVAYQVSTALTLPYGEYEGAVGLVTNVEEMRPLGPLSFAVSGDAVYVLDTVNDRVQSFDWAGRFEKALYLEGGLDMIVNNQDHIFLLESASNKIREYDAQLRPVTDYALPSASVTGLQLTADNEVAMRTAEDKVYVVNRLSSRTQALETVQSHTCQWLNEHTGLIRSQTGREIRVRAEGNRTLGSLNFLGEDSKHRFYVVVEYLLPSEVITVEKEVRKYNSKGKLQAVIPIAINYAAHPLRELVLTPDGVLYHMRPLADRFVIEKWEQVR